MRAVHRRPFLIVLCCAVTAAVAVGVGSVAKAADRGVATTRPAEQAAKQYWAKVSITESRDGKTILWAEPMLVMKDGQRGSFLSGGELPVDLGGGESGADGSRGLKPEYIEYGTRIEITVHQLAPDQLRVSAWFNVSSIDASAGGKENTVIPESGVRVIKTIKPGETLEADLPATRTTSPGMIDGAAKHVTVKIRAL